MPGLCCCATSESSLRKQPSVRGFRDDAPMVGSDSSPWQGRNLGAVLVGLH